MLRSHVGLSTRVKDVGEIAGGVSYVVCQLYSLPVEKRNEMGRRSLNLYKQKCKNISLDKMEAVIINFDKSGHTDLVTSGKLNPSMRTIIINRNIHSVMSPQK